MTKSDEELIAAARAVVERWDTPHWKDVPATAVFINRLRDALCDRLEGRGGGERAGLLDAYEAFIELDFRAAARPDLTAFCFSAGEACRIALGLPKPPPAGQAKQIAQARTALSREGEGFQARVQAWVIKCFGAEIASDKTERADRFVEEALELVQATGYSADRAHALVDYVFGRPVGDPPQEAGGVMVTLATLLHVHGIDMLAAGETELARINQPEIVEKIRAKQAAKPTGSALPVAREGEGWREPQGWKLVPVVATDAMVKSGYEAYQHDYEDDMAGAYEAMLEAAPTREPL